MLTWLLAAASVLFCVALLRCAAVNSRLRTRLKDMEAAVGELADIRLPAVVDASQRPGTRAPGPWRPQGLDGTQYAGRLAAIEAGFAEALQQTRAESEASARSTVRAFAGAVRSLGKELEKVVDEAQKRHHDPEVFGDLTRIDHTLQQLILKAQSAAIVGGDLPGQQWPATALTDVVRGAVSRVRDYRRIQTPQQGEVLVGSRYVEPVVHALAVLLDNAARHSNPSTTVDVTFQEGHHGWSVVIDDAGVKISREELARAEQLLSGAGAADIHRLGDPPRLGFAVLAMLAHRYGFRAFVDGESRYGGTRAGLFLPNELLVFAPRGPVEFRLPGGGAPQQATAAPGSATPAPAPSPAAAGPDGLPKRRRKQRAGGAASPTAAAPAGGGTVSALTPSAVGAWQRGSRTGRPATPPTAGPLGAPAAPGTTDRPDRPHREGSDRT